MPTTVEELQALSRKLEDLRREAASQRAALEAVKKEYQVTNLEGLRQRLATLARKIETKRREVAHALVRYREVTGDGD